MSIQTRPRENLMKMLDENHYLILQMADLQNKGRATDCHIVQKLLLKNLLYLGTLANEQMKKGELQLSPTTGSEAKTPQNPSNSSSTITYAADQTAKAGEATPTIGQQQPRIINCSPQETPFIAVKPRPRRLPSTLTTDTESSPQIIVRPVTSSALVQSPGTEPINARHRITVTLPRDSLQTENRQGMAINETPPTATFSAVNYAEVQPTARLIQIQPSPVTAALPTLTTMPVISSGSPVQLVSPIQVQTSPGLPPQVQQYVATMTPQGMVFVPVKMPPQV